MNNTFNKEELHSLLCIVGATEYHSKNEKKFWDNLTQQLFIAQPELLNAYKMFITNHLSDNIPIVAFTEYYQDKIIIANFIEKSFDKHYSYRGDNRISFFKNIAEKEPTFFLRLHNYITKNRKTLSEFDIYDTYFQLLKSKKTDKSELNKKDILENIDSFYVDRDSLRFKKKLNAYLNIFPKDENLYKHIISKNGAFMEKCAALKNVWEEKIELFPTEIIDLYNQNKTTFDIAKERIGIYYSFALNSEYIVEHTKIKIDDANNFKNSFHNVLAKFISNNISNANKLTNEQRTAIHFICDDVETKDKIQDLCTNIKQDISSLLQPKFFKLSFNEFDSEIDLYLSRLFLATKLNNSLSRKEYNHKTNRKI